MAVDKRITLTYAFTNVLFIACGIVIIVYTLLSEQDAQTNPTTGALDQKIVLPLINTMFAIATGVITLVAGLSSLLPLILPGSRATLHIHSSLCVIACIILLSLGLTIWYQTLQEKGNLLSAYLATNINTIAAYEEQFQCCGFFNSTSPSYVVSATVCPDASTAATRPGCIVSLQPAADLFMDRVFTTLFGFVGIGMCAILASAMMAKARTTEARYIRIEQKGIY